MRRTLLTLAILLMPIAVQAQGFDPCAPSPGSGKVAEGTVVKVRWGQPPAENIDAVTVYRNGQPDNLTTLNAIAPVGSCGLSGYEVVLGAIAAGTYSFEISAWNKSALTGAAQEGPRSSPFVLTSVAPNLPTAPRNVRVGS